MSRFNGTAAVHSRTLARRLHASRGHNDSVAYNLPVRQLLAGAGEALRIHLNAALGNDEASRPFRGHASRGKAKAQNGDEGNTRLRGTAIHTE